MNLILQAIKALLRNNRSDWKQNDPSQPDYIKNRPFYTDDGVLIPETTVTIDEDGGYAELDVLVPMLIAGETYTVILNGVTYKCVARPYPDQNAVLIGNGTVYGDGNLGNGEPFSMDSYEDKSICLNVATAGEYTFTLIGPKEIHKIPEKYLPDGIGGGSGADLTLFFDEYYNKESGRIISGSIQQVADKFWEGLPVKIDIVSVIMRYNEYNGEKSAFYELHHGRVSELTVTTFPDGSFNSLVIGVHNFFGEEFTFVCLEPDGTTHPEWD